MSNFDAFNIFCTTPFSLLKKYPVLSWPSCNHRSFLAVNDKSGELPEPLRVEALLSYAFYLLLQMPPGNI